MQQSTSQDARTPDLLLFRFEGPSLTDGRAMPPDGQWIETRASNLFTGYNTPWDALLHAAGPTLCVVTLSADASYAAESRTWLAKGKKIVKRLNASQMLRAFSLQLALEVAPYWKPSPIVRSFLCSGDATLREAVYRIAPCADEGSIFAASEAAHSAAHPSPSRAAVLAAGAVANVYRDITTAEALFDASADAADTNDPAEWPTPEFDTWTELGYRTGDQVRDRIEGHFNRMVAAAFNMRGFA